MWDLIAIIMMISGAIYVIPQARKTIRYGSALGIAKWSLILWMVDKLSSLATAIHLGNVPFMIKYSVSTICVSIVFYYKFLRKK